MKTIMLKAAALTGFAALIPASLALSAYAAETQTTEPAETVISETEDGATVITKTITVTDEGAEDENETVCYICDDDDLAAGEEPYFSDEDGLTFMFGSAELDTEHLGTAPAEGSYRVLTFEETDALAKEKLTDEQYARWLELTAQMQDAGFFEDEDNNALFDEITTLLNAMSDDDTQWNGFAYTCHSDDSSSEPVGFCSVSSIEDDGAADTSETEAVTGTDITE